MSLHVALLGPDLFAAFDDFVRGRGLTPIVDPGWVRSAEGRALALARRWGGAMERLGI